jgi:YfiH family protein
MYLAEEKNISGLSFLTFPFMEKYGLFCYFTSRYKGYSAKPYRSLNLAYHVGDDKNAVKKNRQLVLEKLLKKNNGYLYSACQVHENNILHIKEGMDHTDGSIDIEADALMTGHNNTPVMVMGADCTLIILADIRNRAVCTVHAGWKGTLNGILTVALEVFSGKFGSGTGEIMVFIGPCIRQCCYEIGTSLAESFTEKFGRGNYLSSKKRKAYLDLAGLNRRQALDSGIAPGNIIDTGICTACNNKYYSYRKEKITGRQAAVAMVA